MGQIKNIKLHIVTDIKVKRIKVLFAAVSRIILLRVVFYLWQYELVAFLMVSPRCWNFVQPLLQHHLLFTRRIFRSSLLQLCTNDANGDVPRGLLNENGEIVLKDGDFIESFVKGWGPGGSKVNKTKNCVVLQHPLTGIVVHCHETRDLHKNRKLARIRLEERLRQKYMPSTSEHYKKMVQSRRRKVEAHKTKISKEEAKRNRIDLDFNEKKDTDAKDD